MIPHIAHRLRTLAASGHLLPLIAVFLAVLGSRLWLIQNYGNDVPVGDQWDAEALKVYKPMLEHGFGAVDWFAAHNEHRVVLTKLSAAAMLLVNNQWDPLLQEIWEAICAATIATLLCVSAIRLIPGKRAGGLIMWLVLIGLAMPFGWENTLQGFQSQFYYLMLLAVSMFHLCAFRGSLTIRRSVLIGVLGTLTLGTLASGSLACLAAACSLLARLAFARQADKHRVVGLAASLVVLALVGFGTTPVVAAHESLHAQSLSQFLKVFSIMLGWPSNLGWLVWLPFVAWGLQTVARRRIDGPGVFVFGLGTFVLLSAAATAAGRGNSIPDIAYVASRYTDLAWYGWLVNLAAAFLLMKRRQDDRLTYGGRLLVIPMFIGAAAALLNAGVAGLAGAAQRGAYYGMESANTRTYVATGNPAALRDKPPGQIPYPDANLLMQWIDDPTIRPLLPPGIRQGMLARSGASPDALSNQGLVPAGVPPGGPIAPAPNVGAMYGTWGPNGNGHKARFVSTPVKAQGTTVHTLVSGYLGRPGLSLYLEDISSGKRTMLVPDRVGAAKWLNVYADIPGPMYRLVAEDTATGEDGWFAFTDPVETGRLRPVVDFLIRIGKGMTLFGLALFLASALAGNLAFRPVEEPEGKV